MHCITTTQLQNGKEYGSIISIRSFCQGDSLFLYLFIFSICLFYVQMFFFILFRRLSILVCFKGVSFLREPIFFLTYSLQTIVWLWINLVWWRIFLSLMKRRFQSPLFLLVRILLLIFEYRLAFYWIWSRKICLILIWICRRILNVISKRFLSLKR